jgi:hypothetical protein
MNTRAALKPTFNNATIKANCNTDVIKAKIKSSGKSNFYTGHLSHPDIQTGDLVFKVLYKSSGNKFQETCKYTQNFIPKEYNDDVKVNFVGVSLLDEDRAQIIAVAITGTVQVKASEDIFLNDTIVWDYNGGSHYDIKPDYTVTNNTYGDLNKRKQNVMGFAIENAKKGDLVKVFLSH